ncbi:MAG: nucleotide sugar dehydrogenase [Proteobacteria bacterium]|nr:nucleotide sugar dehydrogenase [Pseudomonadota bacterium]
MIKKIAIIGAGYVGSSLGVLLATYYEVVLIDQDHDKVNKVNNKQAPLDEPLMQDYLNQKKLNLIASDSLKECLDSQLVILALPTNYDVDSNFFDTSILESVLYELNDSAFNGVVVIKSTIPIGFTNRMQELYSSFSILFVPEFLREGQAFMDNLNPSRIVVGDKSDNAHAVAEVFLSIAKNTPPVLYMNSAEAEAVKLFANTYLATRISFFNELDSFALERGLNAKDIIDGVSTDPRIGDYYNNPSFGYGGYCLPKDTKQLLASFETIPQGIFKAVIESNILRKDFIAQKILATNPKIIGIYRLVMKKGSHNFRESAIFSVMELLEKAGRALLVYEPLLSKTDTAFALTHDLEHFKSSCDLILANRMDDELVSVADKVFTRDLYGKN